MPPGRERAAPWVAIPDADIGAAVSIGCWDYQSTSFTPGYEKAVRTRSRTRYIYSKSIGASRRIERICMSICIPIWGAKRVRASPELLLPSVDCQPDVYQDRSAASLTSTAASRSSRYPRPINSRHTRSTSATYASWVG